MTMTVTMTMLRTILLVVVATLCSTEVQSFSLTPAIGLTRVANRQTVSTPLSKATSTSTTTLLFAEKPEYSRELLLREEAESPFRKVRFFFYISLAIGAFTSFGISGMRIAAGLAGINAELLQESWINAGVDAGGLIVLAFLFQRDLQAQESRLKRASKGATLAKLVIRGSKSMITGDDSSEDETSDSAEVFTTTLASLRRGRGIEKRVVICAGGADMIDGILKQAVELQESLSMSDLLVVPVVMPRGVAPDFEGDVPDCVALPVGGNWKSVVDDEAEDAVSQGVDIEKEGFCVILKKNGRVGQRTKGIFLNRMVGEVEERAELGLDTKNV